MSDNTQQVPQLKPDAVVDIKIGSAFVNKINEAFEYHIIGHEDELKALEARKGEYTTLSGWEGATVTYITLLQEILKCAAEQQLVDYISMEELIARSAPSLSVQP